MSTVLSCSSAFTVGKKDNHRLCGTGLWTRPYTIWSHFLKMVPGPNEGGFIEVKRKHTVAAAEAADPRALYPVNVKKAGREWQFCPIKSVNISPTTTTRELKYVFHLHETYRNKYLNILTEIKFFTHNTNYCNCNYLNSS